MTANHCKSTTTPFVLISGSQKFETPITSDWFQLPPITITEPMTQRIHESTDSAIAVLKNCVPFVNSKPPLKIQKFEFDDVFGKKYSEKFPKKSILITGYGYTEADSIQHMKAEMSPKLKTGIMYYEKFERQEIESNTNYNFTGLKLLPSDKTKRHLCPGDSGGPAFYDNAENLVLIGNNSAVTVQETMGIQCIFTDIRNKQFLSRPMMTDEFLKQFQEILLPVETFQNEDKTSTIKKHPQVISPFVSTEIANAFCKNLIRSKQPPSENNDLAKNEQFRDFFNNLELVSNGMIPKDLNENVKIKTEANVKWVEFLKNYLISNSSEAKDANLLSIADFKKIAFDQITNADLGFYENQKLIWLQPTGTEKSYKLNFGNMISREVTSVEGNSFDSLSGCARASKSIIFPIGYHIDFIDEMQKKYKCDN